jgi:hypothetical protein
MRNPIVVTTLEEDFRKIGLIKESAAPAVETTEPEEDIDEGRYDKLTSGGRRRAPTRQGGKAYKALMRTPEGRKSAKLKGKAEKKPSAKRRARRLRAKRVRKGLADSVQSNSETLKSFANAAIIADKLAGIFTEWVKADEYEAADERMFAGLAGQLGEIAESFADIATAMSEGRLDESAEDVAAAFAEGMEVILDCVDLYEDNNDDEDEDEEEVDDTSGND